ncbi:hypothetical protein [Chitinophaga nivalis]|uniref:Uncharacterized protein n=1 Tax=Chitinophaga nivalis TaxID=2991709 RepID=A0ABT3IJQ6_9BACT|nr:hypothetical protein [Chitinophaga nivalis]MCW3466117.1 hypothetical protein [Chitinophaga nivalis]MCW3484192.1 hypothetical protein [Chitinophaga nivalis]
MKYLLKKTVLLLLLATVFIGSSSFVENKRVPPPPGTSQIVFVNYTLQQVIVTIVVKESGVPNAPTLYRWTYSVPSWGVQYTPEIPHDCTIDNRTTFFSVDWRVATPITWASHKLTDPNGQPVFGSVDGCKGLAYSTVRGGSGDYFTRGCGQYTYELYGSKDCQ